MGLQHNSKTIELWGGTHYRMSEAELIAARPKVRKPSREELGSLNPLSFTLFEPDVTAIGRRWNACYTMVTEGLYSVTLHSNLAGNYDFGLALVQFRDRYGPPLSMTSSPVLQTAKWKDGRRIITLLAMAPTLSVHYGVTSGDI